MKRILGIVFGGLILLSAVSAGAEMKMSVGLKGGLGIASMYDDDVLNYANFDTSNRLGKTALFGANVGAAFKLSFTENMAVTAEVNFAQKGVKFVPINGDDSTFGTIKLTYVDVPILFNYSRKIGRCSPYIEAGPIASVKISAKKGEEVKGAKLDDVNLDETNFTKVAPLDIGFALGAGMGFEVGPGDIMVGLRTSIGFLTIDGQGAGTPLQFSVPADRVGEKARMKNIVPLTISVGYMYNL